MRPGCAAFVDDRYTGEHRPCRKDGTVDLAGIRVCHLHEQELRRAVLPRAGEWHLINMEIQRDILRDDILELTERKKDAARALDRSIPSSVRQLVIERDRRQCSYCGGHGDTTVGPDGRTWHIDHDLPHIHGGRTVAENLVLACATCNLSKHAMTGEEYRQHLLATAPIDDERQRAEDVATLRDLEESRQRSGRLAALLLDPSS